MGQFLQYAHCGVNCQEETEVLNWCDLLQQARLFTMVKETYLFTAYSKGLPRPSGWQQMKQLPAVKKRPTPNATQLDVSTTSPSICARTKADAANEAILLRIAATSNPLTRISSTAAG